MKRLLMLFIPIFILLSGCQLIEESEYTCRIHFIDTGKSDCILIESDKNVLIDAGDNDHQYEVVDYINKLGIKKLDYVVNTHPDADHCGGMDKIVEYFDIGQVFVGNGNSDKKTYKKFIEALEDKKLNPSV
ncbi:MAG: MBL fold metallo-hydrolase, partial [Holdemanella sp.]|nr:MBL fold metallo-hydrolase [Holdemanella sp.]